MLLTDSSYLAAPEAANCQASVPELAARGSAEPRLALIIPTLREVANLPVVLDRVREALDPAGVSYEVVVVDDDSQDGTEELIAAIHGSDPRVRLLVRRGERGLAGAILYGWQNTQADILGVMDADLQHPPELLPQLLEAVLEGRDMAIGSRYTKGGHLGDWNLVRKFLSWAAIKVTWPIQHRGARAQDPMAGFFLVRRACVQGIRFQQAGFKLLLEVLVRGRVRSLAEVPIVFGLREQGDSKANIRVGWDYFVLLMRLYASRFLAVGR